MPKNKKPAGGRPARNFDPYAKTGRSGGKSGPKAGSRSPGHRGYKPEAEGSEKVRWNRDERLAAGRAPHRAERDSREPRDSRDDRGGRPARSYDDRAPRSYDRNDRGDRSARPTRSFDRNDHRDGTRVDRNDRSDRAPRSYDRSDRAPRSYDRADRAPRRDDRGAAPRSYDRNDRGAAPRSYDKSDRYDRAPRSYDRDDRAPRRDDRAERAPRSYERNDRNSAPRSYDKSDRNDRAPRSYGRDDRAPRSYDRVDRAPRSYDKSDRNTRSDRAPRSFDTSDRYDRAPRSYDRDDRAPRRDDRTERPARSYDRNDRNDRAPRSYDRNDRNDRAPRESRAPRGEFDRAGFRDSDRRASDFYPAKNDARHASREEDVVLERLEAKAIQAESVEGVTFGDLGLGNNVQEALAKLGADSPFPIQAATIPMILAGRDVLGRGKTGSGKTIAFGAPAVERLMQQWAQSGKAGGKRQMGRRPRALILAPTRELALQIDRTVQPIAQSVGLFTTQVYGGVPQAKQVGALRRGVDIVIGTPGRIEDLVRQRHLDLSGIVVTVLDEADHMCDLGFLEPVQRILRETAQGGQKLLFSATLDSGVASLVEEFLVDPAVHEVAGEDQQSSSIEHRVFVIENREKRDIVAELANRKGKTLVFSRTRAFTEDLANHLEDSGIRTVSLHGDLNQNRRTRNLQQLTSGRVDVLIATDVAARGIHVDDIDLVIQADAPDEYKTYLHRAGRTGRAGKAGRVITLIPRNRRHRMADLLERAEISLEFEEARLGDEMLFDLGPIVLPAPEQLLSPDAEFIVAQDEDETTDAASAAGDPEQEQPDTADTPDVLEQPDETIEPAPEESVSA